VKQRIAVDEMEQERADRSGRDARAVPPASAAPAPASKRADGVIVGTLIAFSDNGSTPLVTYPGQVGTAALAARSIVDLHGSHIGGDVALLFENGNPQQPIVIGCLHHPRATLPDLAGQVELDVDGQRLTVTAREQMVLRCGKARITLTRAGKILIEGTYVSNRSSGVLRLKGGSVQIN
jgi:hypothetical protein